MNTPFENILFIVGLVTSLLTAIVGFWIIVQFKHPGKNLLGAIFLIWSFNCLANTLLFGPIPAYYQALFFRNAMPIYFFLPSFTYFYVKKINQPSFLVRPIDYVHFVPVAIIFIDLLPYYILPFDQKVQYMEGIKHNVKLLFTGSEGLIRNDVRDMMLGFTFLFYVTKIWKIIAEKYRQQPSTSFSLIKWSIFLAIMLTVLFILKLSFFSVLVSDIGVSELRVMFSQIVVIYISLFSTICFYVWYNYRELNTVWGSNEEVYLIDEADSINSVEPIELDPEVVNQFDKYVNAEKPYLKVKYSLNDLAHETNLPTYQISHIIKGQYGVNFNDYINSLRVEEVKKRLEDDEYQNYSIEGISKDCGFNAKSTFFTVFKKHTGVTPMEYQKNARQNTKKTLA